MAYKVMAEAGDAVGLSQPDILWADTGFSIIFSVLTTNMTTGRLILVPMGMMVVKYKVLDQGKVQKAERYDSDGREKEQRGGRVNNRCNEDNRGATNNDARGSVRVWMI